MSRLEARKVLVVGGAGFVGSNLVAALLENSSAAIDVVDNLLSSERSNLPDDSRVNFLLGSIADDQILAQVEDVYDFVFHLATYHGNQSSIHDPLADHQNNLLTTLKLFERLKGFKRLKRVVYAGAGCAVAEKTYDSARATLEDAPISLEMDSPYSISKIVGEFYAVYYHRQHGLPVVRARFQNVYGPREILGAGRWRGTAATVWRNVVPTFIYKGLKGDPLTLHAGGEATRDFIQVSDLVRGLCLCLSAPAGEVYNLATERETRILDLATLINRLTGGKSEFVMLPPRGWDRSGRRFGSGAKAKSDLGFEPRVDLEQGLRETVTWTRENLSLIEACIARHRPQMDALGKECR